MWPVFHTLFVILEFHSNDQNKNEQEGFSVKGQPPVFPSEQVLKGRWGGVH